MSRRAYLDHASTSPLRPAVLEAMLPYLREHHGDPGRLHEEGRATRVAVEDARARVAALFGARPREVVFTSGGTEAVNAGVWGAIRHAGRPGHVVSSAVEHSSVLDCLRREAVDVTLVSVDERGRFDSDEVAAAITDDTIAVVLQAANHEVGTRQPVTAACAYARERGVLTLVDACAASGRVPVDFHALGADVCAVTAHKAGGPKGIGALLVRRGLRVPPFVLGGAQERARRGGLENVPAAVGFGALADELADGVLDAEGRRSRDLTEEIARRVLGSVTGVIRHGDPDDRLPDTLCFVVDGVEAEPILLALDQRGVAVHSGSSCSSEALEPSPVLTAMGADADHSLRIGVGWNSTSEDVDAVCTALPDVVAHLRALRTSG